MNVDVKIVFPTLDDVLSTSFLGHQASTTSGAAFGKGAQNDKNEERGVVHFL